MQWHPTHATLLMIACEDDMSPVIQLWELRSAAAVPAPAREFLGHNKASQSVNKHTIALIYNCLKIFRSHFLDCVRCPKFVKVQIRLG